MKEVAIMQVDEIFVVMPEFPRKGVPSKAWCAFKNIDDVIDFVREAFDPKRVSSPKVEATRTPLVAPEEIEKMKAEA